MSAKEQLIATVSRRDIRRAIFANLNRQVQVLRRNHQSFVDECAGCSREPVYCPDCGKQHSGFRAFGAYMMDGKTPCDGYDCTWCGNRWHIIRAGGVP